jgi:hypothetical protein
MKFLFTFLVYAAMAVLLGAGIIASLHGSFWLLLAGVMIYLIAFSKFGCLSH